LKLLIIEDELALKESLIDYLSASGYLCESATHFNEAVEKIELFDYDCIVLDIMLPGGSGLQILQYLKDNKKTDGVIIVSAKNALEDKINGIALGADDYLTKPFHLSELSVRIAAIIRRKQFNGQSVLQHDFFSIDTIAKSVKVNNQLLDLTQKEYQLLLFFIINKNRVLSKNAIAQHLWGDDMDYADNYDFLYTHIKNLRKKIITVGGDDCIKSMYREGYKMMLS
jgi:DNA-binding response OmpR family regulator